MNMAPADANDVRKVDAHQKLPPYTTSGLQNGLSLQPGKCCWGQHLNQVGIHAEDAWRMIYWHSVAVTSSGCNK